MSIESIANTLGGAKRTPEGYLCKCPCHDDKTASLSITQKEDGTLIYNCFAGCDWQIIRDELQRQGLTQARNGNGTPYDRYAGAKFYVYRDSAGAILCRKVKMPDKKMWFERYESGKYIPGLEGMAVPLYNIAQVSSSELVYLCEGEKDAETLINRGYCATTNHAGAKSWHPSLTEQLRNKRVIIIPDNDDAGRKRIDILTNALRGAVAELLLFTPDGVEEHGDITDWVNNGGDVKTILERATVLHRRHVAVPKTFTHAIACDLPEPDQVLENMLDRGDKMLVVGHSKTKKTFFITQLALSLATGTNFLGIEVPKKRKVLIVQFEVQEHHFFRRLRRMSEALEIGIDDVEDRILILSARGVKIDYEETQKYIEQEGIEVVMFDPFYKMFEGDESDVEEVKRILAVFDRIVTHSKCALIYVHHDKKGSSERTEQRDRGGGTGVLARDYDVGVAISEHDSNPQAIVCDFLLRNYREREPLTAEWADSHFIGSDLQPIVKKAGVRKLVIDLSALEKSALAVLENGSMECMAYRGKLRSKLGLSHTKERELVSMLLESGKMKIIPGVTKLGIKKKFSLTEPSKRNEPYNTGDLF